MSWLKFSFFTYQTCQDTIKEIQLPLFSFINNDIKISAVTILEKVFNSRKLEELNNNQILII